MSRISAWEGPVLRSVLPVIGSSLHVRTDEEAIDRVARWMAYEEFAMPDGSVEGPFDFGPEPETIIDATMLTSSLNFAYTDFDTGERFEADYDGRTWADAEAMYARIHRAHRGGTPVFDGAYLASVGVEDLEQIFQGSIRMPMLEERARILNEVGGALVDRYGGRFHNFVRSCPQAAYANGDGLLERLVEEFPRFRDESTHGGHTVRFYKLGQLCLWSMHVAMASTGTFAITDLDRLTAFADYILPVALQVMGILEFSDELDSRIRAEDLIGRDSAEEVELRAHTVYATALLTDAINGRRPAHAQVVTPQVDYRLWSTYHTTFPTLRRHHLTRTTMY